MVSHLFFWIVLVVALVTSASRSDLFRRGVIDVGDDTKIDHELTELLKAQELPKTMDGSVYNQFMTIVRQSYKDNDHLVETLDFFNHRVVPNLESQEAWLQGMTS